MGLGNLLVNFNDYLYKKLNGTKTQAVILKLLGYNREKDKARLKYSSEAIKAKIVENEINNKIKNVNYDNDIHLHMTKEIEEMLKREDEAEKKKKLFAPKRQEKINEYSDIERSDFEERIGIGLGGLNFTNINKILQKKDNFRDRIVYLNLIKKEINRILLGIKELNDSRIRNYDYMHYYFKGYYPEVIEYVDTQIFHHKNRIKFGINRELTLKAMEENLAREIVRYEKLLILLNNEINFYQNAIDNGIEKESVVGLDDKILIKMFREIKERNISNLFIYLEKLFNKEKDLYKIDFPLEKNNNIPITRDDIKLWNSIRNKSFEELTKICENNFYIDENNYKYEITEILKRRIKYELELKKDNLNNNEITPNKGEDFESKNNLIDQDTLIEKFQKACEDRNLKKSKTIPNKILYEIACESGITKSDLTEFKPKSKEYQIARQYASQLGYKRKRPFER